MKYCRFSSTKIKRNLNWNDVVNIAMTVTQNWYKNKKNIKNKVKWKKKIKRTK